MNNKELKKFCKLRNASFNNKEKENRLVMCGTRQNNRIKNKKQQIPIGFK